MATVYVDSCKPHLYCSDPECAMPAWLTVRADADDDAPEPAWCVDDAEKLIRAATDLGGETCCSEPANRVLAIEGVDL